jgi:hypothetical protein
MGRCIVTLQFLLYKFIQALAIPEYNSSPIPPTRRSRTPNGIRIPINRTVLFIPTSKSKSNQVKRYAQADPTAKNRTVAGMLRGGMLRPEKQGTVPAAAACAASPDCERPARAAWSRRLGRRKVGPALAEGGGEGWGPGRLGVFGCLGARREWRNEVSFTFKNFWK